LAGAVTTRSFRHNGSEAAGAVYTVTNTVNLPALAPWNLPTALATLRHVSRIAAQAAAQVSVPVPPAPASGGTPSHGTNAAASRNRTAPLFPTHFPESQTYTGL